MIQLIKLVNYQGHAESDLELSEGLNVIVGDTDSGKSSLIRAVEWVRTNRPVGTGYMRRGGEQKTGVALRFKGGDRVARARSVTTNKYRVNGVDLEAVGTGVPTQVTDVLQMTELNVQAQREIDFLLGRPPGEVAQRLNDAVDLGLIDSSASSINRSITRTSRSLQAAETAAAEELAYLERMSWVPDTAGKVETARMLIGQMSHLERDGADLERVIEQLQAAENALAAVPKPPNTNAVDEALQQWRGVCTQRDGLEQLVFELHRAETELAALEQQLTPLEKQYTQEFPDVCPLCGARNRKGRS